MKRSGTIVLLTTSIFTLLGCGDHSLTEGLEEPISVHDAQFVKGELPGSKPLSAADIADGEVQEDPRPTPPGTDVVYLRQGLAGTRFYGWTSADSVAVAIKVEGEGTGYWLLPAGRPDPALNGALTWDLTLDLHASLTAGLHELRVAAIDSEGKSGTQATTTICVNSLVPDNGNACYPDIAPPDLVIGLEWNSNADLDLIVITPDGQRIESKNPTSAVKDDSGNIDTTADGIGNLDFDSNKDCRTDGRRREHVVFQKNPPAGNYFVYTNLHQACGTESAAYRVSLHTRTRGGGVKSTPRAAGELIALQANGSTELGTFVTQFKVQ